MTTCKVCLRSFKTLRFNTSRIAVCGRCVSTLNSSPELAEFAQERIGALLRTGMMRSANRDLESEEDWRQRSAVARLENFDDQYRRALPDWLTKLLKDPKNSTRDFKLVRAHRRGLLHFDRPKGWGYPPGWPEVASRIRQLDGYRCSGCGAQDRPLDVHHIVYVSNFGTHQQSNLVALCRPCHEAEHGRSFDMGEAVGDQVPPDTGPPSRRPVSPREPIAPSLPPGTDMPTHSADLNLDPVGKAVGEAEHAERVLVVACQGCGTKVRGRVTPGRMFEVRCPGCHTTLRFTASGKIVPPAGAGSGQMPFRPSPSTRDEHARANQRQQEQLLRQAQAAAASARSTADPVDQRGIAAITPKRHRRPAALALVVLTLVYLVALAASSGGMAFLSTLIYAVFCALAYRFRGSRSDLFAVEPVDK